MTVHQHIKDIPETQWATLYAKAYSELCALISSFADNTIGETDLVALYRRQTAEHEERVIKLATKAAQLMAAKRAAEHAER